jgi:hypothetical protein
MFAKFKSFTSSLILFIFATWLALWLIEGMARFMFHGTVFAPAGTEVRQIRHASRGSALPANAVLGMYQLAHAETAQINSKGFRGPEPETPSNPAKTRILLLSDSNGFGSGVADSDTLAVKLQEELGNTQFEVLNFSVPAYSNVQELIWLREEGFALKPAIVLFGFTPVNDIQTNYLPLQELYQSTSKRPYAQAAADGGITIDNGAMVAFSEKEGRIKPLHVLRDIFAGPMLQRLVERAVGRKKSDPNIWIGWPFLTSFSEAYAEEGLKVADYEKLWMDAWEVTKRLIVTMRNETEANGARFVMFSHVAKLEADPAHLSSIKAGFPELSFDVGKAERELRAFANEESISFVSGSESVKAEKDLFFSIDDDHMNGKGYAVFAKALADDLRKQGLVSP